MLINSSLHDVVLALDLSRKCFTRIRVNFVWAMMYNVCALPIASGLLYPFTSFHLPPAFAGLAMAFSSITVVISSLSLRLYRRPHITTDGDIEFPGFCQNLQSRVAYWIPFIGDGNIRRDGGHDGRGSWCNIPTDEHDEVEMQNII